MQLKESEIVFCAGQCAYPLRLEFEPRWLVMEFRHLRIDEIGEVAKAYLHRPI